MPIIILACIATALVCIGLARRYTFMTMEYQFSKSSGYGFLRDARSGLKIARIHADSCDASLDLASGGGCIDELPEYTVYRIPRLLHGIMIPSKKDRPCLMLKRSRYNNLLQYASGYKKLPEREHACC